MNIRDRIKELRRVPAKELRPNPHKWKKHPVKQHDALRALLALIGYAGALIAWEPPDGSLQIIDGHLRAETTPETAVPVLVLDVTEEEAKLLLATYDPLAELYEPDTTALETLLAEVAPSPDAIQAMLDELSAEAGIEPPNFAPVSIEEQDRLDAKNPIVCPNCGTVIARPA